LSPFIEAELVKPAAARHHRRRLARRPQGAAQGAQRQRPGRAHEDIPPNPDEELAPDWRDGGYPYKNLLRPLDVRKAEVQAAGRTAQAAKLGQGNRGARGHHL
jgi:hypothetical protein